MTTETNSYISEYIFRDVVQGDVFVDPLARHIVKDPTRVPLIEASVNMTPFTKTSIVHGRSMEDPHGLVLDYTQPLVDENGDLYTSLSIKGADASLPTVSFNDVEINKVRVNGMLDPAAMDRC